MARKGILIFAALALVCAWAPVADAATWYVSKDNGQTIFDGTSWATACTNVQACLDKASPGDTVKVEKATYFENLHMRANTWGKGGNGVALLGGYLAKKSGSKWSESRDWQLNVTTLNGVNPLMDTVNVNNCPNPSTLVDGFSITQGGILGIVCNGGNLQLTNNQIFGNQGSGGVGIWNGCTATIQNNKIHDNSSPHWGAGLDIRDSETHVLNNSIYSNVSGTIGTGLGGGVYIGESPVDLRENIIQGNSTGTMGGGIWIVLPLGGTVSDNEIVGNSSGGSGGGIGVTQNSAGIEISRNRIEDNTALNGGGIYFQGPGKIANNFIVQNIDDGMVIAYGASPLILNNTVADNSAIGIDCDYSLATIANNIFSGNGWYGMRWGGQPLVTHNDVFGNGLLWNGSNYAPGNTAGPGDISVDPAFIDTPSGDYHLSLSSLCVNAGSNAYAATPTDIDLENRIMGDIVDMGADEVYVNVPPTVVSTSPPDGATGVLIRVQPAITFSESVAAGTNYSGITLRNDSTGSNVTITKSILGGILTLTPSASLAKSTHFTVTIPVNGVQDLTGLGLATQYTFGFTTGTH